MDDATLRQVLAAPADRWLIYTTRRPLKSGAPSFELAPWSDDDVIEWMLASRPDRCSWVMKQLLADGFRHALQGSPALLRLAAEQLADDPRIQDIRTALRTGLRQSVRDWRTWELAHDYAAHSLAALDTDEQRLASGLASSDRAFLSLLRSRAVKLLLAADHALGRLMRRQPPFLASPVSRDLVDELAQLVRSNPVAIKHCHVLLRDRDARCDAMVASLLHRVDASWRPRLAAQLDLRSAYLANSQWRGVQWPGAQLQAADLSRSDLRDCRLPRARLENANLSAVQAQGATFVERVGLSRQLR